MFAHLLALRGARVDNSPLGAYHKFTTTALKQPGGW